MPTPTSTYFSGPVFPQQLNTDMYTSDNSVNGANGILFFSHRPILSETVLVSGTAYTGLSQQPVNGLGLTAFTVIDTSALFSVGADSPGIIATFRFRSMVIGSNGAANGRGGQWLSWGFPFTAAVTTPPGGVGAAMFLNGSIFDLGVFQYGSTGHNNCPWFLDLINSGNGTVNTWQPAFWWLTASTPVLATNSTSTSGQTTRMGWAWQGVSTGGGTVGAIPDPVRSWGTVTSAALNTSIGSCFTLLNNPPMLRVSNFSSQSLTTATNTKITFPGAVNVDNYNSWSTANSIYTVPLPGLYLFCPTLVWGTQTTVTGIRRTGITVVPGGTGVAQNYLGATYAPSPVGPGVSGIGFSVTSMVKVLNLSKGDQVNTYGFQNSGGNLPLLSTFATRLIGAYMNPVAPAGSVITYAAPNTSFRWQAGALSGTALTAALNQHIGQDISFLMNKPYFTGYQTVAQTGFTNAAFFKVTMDTIGALPAGGNGDNYKGWSTANSWYVSQLAGWYLCVADLYAVPPISGTVGVLTGGLSVSSSGSITPPSTPDQYQQVLYPIATGGSPPGVTAIGLYYLLPGEHVHPVMQTQSWGGTWGTFVQSGSESVNSQFSCWWVAE